MNEAQVWVAIQMVPFLGLLAFLLIGWHLRQQRVMRQREMQHQERQAAINKGLPVEPLPEEITPVLVLGSTEGFSSERAALLTGLVLLFGGLGMLVALTVMAQMRSMEKLSAIAMLGLIPMMVGGGLLLYFWLSRRMKLEGGSGER